LIRIGSTGRNSSRAFRLRPPLILTTNYDTLLEDAYAAEYGLAATVYTYRDAAVVQRSLQTNRLTNRPVIFKIHGQLTNHQK
jgi:hypothetical protein